MRHRLAPGPRRSDDGIRRSSFDPEVAEAIGAGRDDMMRHRDVGLLEVVLARPKNLHTYDAVGDVPTLAAASGFAGARNHPFVDKNERVVVLLVAVFVALNGSGFDSDRVDEVTIVLGARRWNARRARVRSVGRGTVLAAVGT